MNKKSRIVIFSVTPLGIGGMEENILQLAEGLSNRFEVIIMGSFNQSFLTQVAERTFDIQLIPVERPSKYNILFGFKLLKNFIKLKPDLIHFQDPRSRLLGAPISKLLGIKSLYTFHMSPLFLCHTTLKTKVYQFIEYLYNFYLTDALLFVSMNVKNWYAEQGLIRKQKPNDFVVLNGIDTSPFIPLLANKDGIRNRIRKQLQISSETRLALAVGRLTTQKGFDYLIQALGYLKQHSQPLKIAIAGDGEEKNHLVKLATDLELSQHIIWLGFQKKEQVRELLIAADVFVLPSRYECYPYSILEANAAQVPVIVSNVGGSAEAASFNAQYLIVPPNDPKALSDAIKKILSVPTIPPITLKNSVGKMVNETQEVIKTVLNTR